MPSSETINALIDKCSCALRARAGCPLCASGTILVISLGNVPHMRVAVRKRESTLYRGVGMGSN
eukprot:91079-Pelagomonas_calceolata.AAC.3